MNDESPQIIAYLSKQCGGDIASAEDALQEATLQAHEHWAENGLPEKPAAWLCHVARCRLLDKLRQDSRGRLHFIDAQLFPSDSISELDVSADYSDGDDQRLALIFCCCHPAIDETSQLALLLQLIGGLTYRDIANQLLLSADVVQRRLSRAKKKIKEAKVPFEVPEQEQLYSRQGHIRSMIYLMFNHSMEMSVEQAKPLLRQSIDLLLLLRKTVDSPESMALQALLMSVMARRTAEACEFGLALSEQDRSQWDRVAIKQADNLLQQALRFQQLGPLQLQAAIHLLHSQSPSWEETDWQQIISLYDLLIKMQPSALPRLNKYMAQFYSGVGAKEILDKVSSLMPELENYSAFYGAKMILLLELADLSSADEAYQQALALEAAPRQRELLIQNWQKAQLNR
ncbi:sigma-70 family RNA polymerase sigma factor [uncultured Pseudoteredinibacter sp.]|uniref:RNA polymerase sigma factor n=1 Tax=uncultured Pseudoteredinibacter sp. TaxID=1641701 RepID=UPI0026291A65|nr:sigma-70 family RNA polymerase sigma factor [uncultured Pseudoteredinibacter sp.]